ncbi:hypothetical protein GCM10009687_59970 [Asanoa iriomotensis]|uniref:Uncharacterized protein n=1 Tax=Asanoa iriomotensis TaxID=234613 RepID=A0ABQ4BVL1_9ACTN|nr:hypothetical protein Air01nite_02860 [Asanoa iriomotensis]
MTVALTAKNAMKNRSHGRSRNGTLMAPILALPRRRNKIYKPGRSATNHRRRAAGRATGRGPGRSAANHERRGRRPGAVARCGSARQCAVPNLGCRRCGPARRMPQAVRAR